MHLFGENHGVVFTVTVRIVLGEGIAQFDILGQLGGNTGLEIFVDIKIEAEVNIRPLCTVGRGTLTAAPGHCSRIHSVHFRSEH